jgi:hypothetical protein
MTAEDDLRLYCDTFYGDNEGYVSGALARNPRVENGKYKTDWAHTDRRTNLRSYKWPERREVAVAQILEHDCDAHLVPYLMAVRKRNQGTSVPETRTHVHADNDEGHPDWLDRVRAIRGGVATGSGTPGNGHAYVLLTRSVPLHHHEQLCRALGEHLGTKDNTKFHDNDCLRPAGTSNYKPTVMDGGGLPPAPVTWLITPNGERIDPDELGRHLDVELTELTGEQFEAEEAEAKVSDRKRKSRRDRDWLHAETEEVAYLSHRWGIKSALKRKSGDRSADIMRVVGACASNGLTLPQTRWVVNQRDDLVEKLSELTHDDVERCFKKATDSRDEKHDEKHTEEAMNTDGQGSRDKPFYTDIAAMLDGTLPEPPTPEVLSRSDGRAMFYKGEVNLVFGDPEHGKTWVLLGACAEALIDGGRVIYVDLDHNGAAAIVSRLLLRRSFFDQFALVLGE